MSFWTYYLPVQNCNCLQKRDEGRLCEVRFGSSSLLNFGILRVKLEGKKKDKEELEVFPIRLY